MPMLIIGVLLLLLRAAEIGPFADLSWWWVALPFAGAVAWWQFADSSGLTRKREMDKLEKRKEDRRDKAMEALGMNTRRAKQATRSRRDAARRNSQLSDPTQTQYPPEPRRGDPRR